ncbi:tautomerase family protein [Roseovarius sp. CAU 1744]|uniref:tautomerase family protein n=1 Tax=Roseovarius sp. CAU 1744 TaxID=3140368 RepID=UPI00325BCADB
MPLIRVELMEGRDIAQKRELARQLTEVFVAVCGGKPAAVQVLIDDKSPGDWAVAGQLLCDRNGT